ncbi:MAG: DUF2163 domain-containing protein, partial [Hyphomicrobiaceae bacterium]
MKTLPPAFQAHLDSGTTTLCWCWRITPGTGPALGFTDHDRDLLFDGTLFEAASGFSPTELRSTVGLSVDNLEVESALVSDRLDEDRLGAGDFDDAPIEIFRVNWSDPQSRVLMRKGSLGEVRRTATMFSAEIRGLAHYLGQPQGRVFQYACDADLGDARCGIDLADPVYRGTGTVLAPIDQRSFTTVDLASFADGWFTRGLLTFTSGENTGRAGEVKRHTLTANRATIELWQPPGAPVSPGDTFSVTAGCDKSLGTCRTRFANARNHRGF